MSLMFSFLLLKQLLAYVARPTWIVCEMGRTTAILWTVPGLFKT